ncbi:MAG: hypothetical protein IH916_06195 [Acidobacteria bacterium]|nr:hypothetical protein [Acidobacteriota bacterium]
MIEADPQVAGLLQAFGGRQVLGEALRRVGQAGLVDQALVLFHPGHVGIAEQADPVRRQDRGRTAA